MKNDYSIYLIILITQLSIITGLLFNILRSLD